jgi:ketosteroid isomerase-like protein
MKRINWFLFGTLIVLAVLPLLIGCATISKAADWAPEQKEVIAVMETWEKAYHSGNITTLDKLLADEIDITAGSLKGTFRDKVSYLKAYKSWYAFSRPMVSPVSTSITYLAIQVSGDEASVIRRIDWSQRGDRGLQQGTETKTTCLKKLDGKWKIYSVK